MKILHVITSLRTGGAEKLMVDLLPRMKAQGYDVELCVFDGIRTDFYEEIELAGVKIHPFKVAGNVYNPCNIWRLRELIHKGKYDIVHTHNTAPQYFAAVACLGLKPILVTTEHNTDNRRRNKPVLKPADKWMYGRYRSIICISEQASSNLHEYLPSLKGICTVFNGIDYKKYADAEPARDVRDIGNKIITMVAAFRLQKDQSSLIKAMPYLPSEFQLCLVGGGDVERKFYFERMISELHLQNRVHLLGLRNDIPNVLAASDYVVMSSHYEGLSLSNLEGMASGKPFIASDVDGLHEIVDGSGVLVEPQNANAIAQAILKLDADGDYKDSIVRSCQEKASHYDISKMVGKYIDLYENLSIGES